jgi:hypothetical protein
LGVIFLDLPCQSSILSLVLFNVEPHPYFRWCLLSQSSYLGGGSTFLSVIFKSYSTAGYFSNVSEGSFGHQVLRISLPSSWSCARVCTHVSGPTYVAGRNGEMTSMGAQKRHCIHRVTSRSFVMMYKLLEGRELRHFPRHTPFFNEM